MKITLAPSLPPGTRPHTPPTVTIDTHSDDHDIYDLAPYLRQALLAYGYGPKTVAEIFPED